MMWQIFFLVVALIFGAFFRMVLPKWLPYTVGLLLVGIIVGAMAQHAVSLADCPMYALQHDADGDGYISEAEYKHFICEGCNPDSFCIAAGRTGPFADKYFSTCGDGSAQPPSHRCWYTFDWLDSPWKLSSMHAESKFAYPNEGSGSSHGRGFNDPAGSGSSASGSSAPSAPLSGAALSLARAAYPAGDGRLSADELWTTRCNLLIDMISLKDIDPHMMLVVFLPALLYESAAFGVDMGIFLKQLPQILILAFPAMVTASLFTALMLYALAPASWSFWMCWLIGVIASATDPVAVVALLKELGASKALGTLIEGESLLNDGSAVVLFVWVRNAIGYDYSTLAPEWMRGDSGELHARGEGQTGLELLRIIAQMLLLGVVLGWAFGYATKWVLKFVYNDRFVESSFIIGMSYLVFWLGELVMGSSAVLAVVVMGLYMNFHKSVISPGVQHFLHEFYEMIAHVMNTVIFLIAGCKLGALIFDTSLHQLWDNTSTRSMILMMWPIILIARGGAILLFFPIISRLGTKCTWKDAIVMWWGGLRGSVGLALGLTVHHMMYDKNMWGEGFTSAPLHSDGRPPSQDSLDCRDQPLMVLALTIVCVVFTVVIQGVSMAPLMQLLSMTKTPDERNFMLQSAYRKLHSKTQAFREQMRAKDELSSVDWESVDKHVLKPTNNVAILHPDKAAWLLVVNLERAYYHAQFENAVLSSEAFAVLEAFMANLAAQASVEPEDALGKLYDRMFEQSLIHRVFNRHSIPASTAYEIGLAYLAGQREVRHLLGTGDEGDDHESSQHGGGGSGGGGGSAHGGGACAADAEVRASLREVVGARRRSSVHGLELVAREHLDNEEKIRKAMRNVESRAPQAVRHFQTHWAKRLVLNHQERLISHMLHEGELLDLDALPLRQSIEHQLALLYTEPLKDAVQDAVNEARRSITRRATRSNLHDDERSPGRSPGRGKQRAVRTGPESPIAAVVL